VRHDLRRSVRSCLPFQVLKSNRKNVVPVLPVPPDLRIPPVTSSSSRSESLSTFVVVVEISSRLVDVVPVSLVFLDLVNGVLLGMNHRKLHRQVA
jgi:hypothetical protein